MLFSVQLTGCSSKGGDATEQMSAEELYNDATRYMINGNYAEASRYFKRLQARFPYSRFAEQALLDLSYSYYRDNSPEKATAQANRFIKTYPTHPNVDYAFYIKGLINFDRTGGFFESFFPQDSATRDQQYSLQAFQDFAELIQRYPNSRYVEDAKQRMYFLRNRLAQHEIAIAKYYIRKHAWVGAANRAKYVIDTYPESPQSKDALAIMIVSYRELGFDKLAADTERVLQENDPNHPYFSGSHDSKSFLSKLWPF